MIVGSDGQRAVIEKEDRPTRPEHPSSDCASEPAGQMFMIGNGVEALLKKGEPLRMLKPTQAWRRITGHLKGTGIDAREMPHRSTYNRFRRRYGSKYGLRCMVRNDPI
jgi:hypothetical protein